jgi:3-dehydroquinate synthase
VSQSVHGFSVPFRFPVTFTRGIWRCTNPTLLQTVRSLERHRQHRVLVVVDDQVARARPALLADIEAYCSACAGGLALVAPPLLVPGGEAAKNDLSHCFSILQRIHDVGLDRQSFVVVLGGGAVLDVASFAAAIAHRGIRTIRLPTTVLSQADSGIAVKNGLNLFGKKNFIGTFVPPFAVLNDLDFLDSLERRDTAAGIAEVIKVALLRDPALFDEVEAHAAAIAGGDSTKIAAVVQRSAELHLAHVCGSGDPFELGSARPLDFGHWAAHKLESMTRHRLRHGEAVAIGMTLDLTYAMLMGYLNEQVLRRVRAVIRAVGLPEWDDALLEPGPEGRLEVLSGLEEFREHLGGELHVTLVQAIGRSFETNQMDDAVVRQAIGMMAPSVRQRSAVATIGAAHTVQ